MKGNELNSYRRWRGMALVIGEGVGECLKFLRESVCRGVALVIGEGVGGCL